ncbi:peptidoglycan-binding domain-containing protein [Luteimicrobium subarcticum]|uniref:Putative peptidoglycan binding protein n=1 Tax=Luteimicrobium subarcticum TaxID=620910 RepID=A0A2M8WW66_9MICO|nr:peptidoglycan-binding domain-containing protein [Luteimicrobium subarcticum]PJI95160.1 putative peptidoglycan binding protein [Luteimicrobium subarcticum]
MNLSICRGRDLTRRTSLMLAVLMLLTLAVTVLPQGSAQAAGWPKCNTERGVSGGSYWYWYYPITTTTSNELCSMAQGQADNFGSGNSPVYSLQLALKRCYHQSIDADGVFGPATRNALIAAQGVAKVTQDGVWGPNTRNAMKWPEYWGDTYDHCIKWNN